MGHICWVLAFGDAEDDVVALCRFIFLLESNNNCDDGGNVILK